jgi:hypothetical protein
MIKKWICFWCVLQLFSCRNDCISFYNLNDKYSYANGTVIKKYIDHEYKNTPRIIIEMPKDKNGENKQWCIGNMYRDTIGFYRTIQVNDSIIKQKGSLVLKIIRRDTTFTYDLADDCCRLDGSGCQSR